MSAIDYGIYRAKTVSGSSRVQFAVVDTAAQSSTEDGAQKLLAGGSSAAVSQTPSRVARTRGESDKGVATAGRRSLVRPDRPQSRSGVAFGVVTTPMSAVSPESGSNGVRISQIRSTGDLANKVAVGIGRNGFRGERKNSVSSRSVSARSRSRSSASAMNANVIAAEAQIISAIKLLAILIVMMAMFAAGVAIAGGVFSGVDSAALDSAVSNSASITENLPSLLGNS